jgi:hypothetical protein
MCSQITFKGYMQTAYATQPIHRYHWSPGHMGLLQTQICPLHVPSIAILANHMVYAAYLSYIARQWRRYLQTSGRWPGG